MRTSDQIDQIAAALALAQSEMKNATLNKVNPHFKSKYADLAGIRDTITPALAKHGLSIAQGTDADEKGVMVITRMMHKSGQWIESRFPIAFDAPQKMGSAYTYARRYSLSAMCSIAADEDDDANSAPDTKPTPMAKKVEPQLLKREEARALYKQLETELVTMDSAAAVQDWVAMRGAEIAKLGDWRSYIDKAVESHMAFVVKKAFEGEAA